MCWGGEGIGEGREWGRGLEKTMGKGMQLPGGLVRILVLVLRAGVREGLERSELCSITGVS